ncbi:MAG: hypothetical protein ABL956_18850, partial [Hyphomonadaceae bacterium]
MKFRLAVAVLTALLVFPFTAKAQMPGSDIAWMRTCSSEREASQAFMRRTYGADTVKTAAWRISTLEEFLYGIFKRKKELEGLIAEDGQDAATLRSMLAEAQTNRSAILTSFDPQSPPAVVSYAQCVLNDLVNFVQANIQARLDEIGKTPDTQPEVRLAGVLDEELDRFESQAELDVASPTPPRPATPAPTGPGPQLIVQQNEGTPCLEASLAGIHRTSPPQPNAEDNY